MKVTKRLVSCLLAIMTISLFALPAFAATEQETLTPNLALSNAEKVKFDEWVEYNSVEKTFYIKAGAQDYLSLEEYHKLEIVLSITNENINKFDFSTGEVSVIAPGNKEIALHAARAPYTEGVDAIELYWWGVRIFLSKTTVNMIGAGVTIGGIWIPEPLVSKILATVGVVIALCPGGIWFDYNFILAGITAVMPGMPLMFSAVTGFGFQ